MSLSTRVRSAAVLAPLVVLQALTSVTGAACGTCLEQGGTNGIRIGDASGAGLCAFVTFLDGDDPIAQVDVTSPGAPTACSGRVDVPNLPEGTYTVHVEAAGFEPLEVDLDFNEIGGCDYVGEIALEGEDAPNGPVEIRMKRTP